ncbi:type I glutamate--ammonia ligase [Candidatus Curtissbacteria bacterium]|nr:type I glutamate--ammonia ligase [Candidatus Curtissbacteria bacterium]
MIDLRKVLTLTRSGEIEFVDLRFVDLRGVWQHMSIPAHELKEKNLEMGYGFDGSSIRGFQTISESDMLLMPDVKTFFFDPFFEKTINVICNVFDPATGKNYPKDPRYTAQKAENYLKKSGIGDISYWGPEIEYFLFDSLGYYVSPYESFVKIASSEFPPEDPNSPKDGYKILHKTGYFPVPPFDKLQAFRSEFVILLEKNGVEIEVHHHEVASGGQVEIDMHYDALTAMADKVMIYKYLARNLAKKYQMTACFLPKPLYADNGSGMHTHQSLFKQGRNLFYDPKGYAEMSEIGFSYLAGLLVNIKTLLAITNPTVNSYRRLVPHFEAPTSIAFSKRNRSATVRIPMYYKKIPNAKRIEFRVPDPTCNPYLSFAAQLVYGIEGIKNKLDPKKLGFGPHDENIYEMAKIEQTPNNLFTVLENLKKDQILIKSGVFDAQLVNSYLDVRTEDAQQNLLYPTPADFMFYSDI